jgi:hypothetical protein
MAGRPEQQKAVLPSCSPAGAFDHHDSRARFCPQGDYSILKTGDTQLAYLCFQILWSAVIQAH